MTGGSLELMGVTVLFLGIFATLAWTRHRTGALDVLSDILVLAGEILIGLGELAHHEIWWALACFAMAAWYAWRIWRRKRRDRTRAARAYGAKSRALIAALAAKAREAAKPRPVLKPAPGGAR